MTRERVLITGGAGFIGSHLADALLADGRHVRVLDALLPQVHGDPPDWPAYLAHAVERIRGDAGSADVVGRALDGVDVVVHLAAAVGVGQSMYEVSRYVRMNTGATATLLEQVIERRDRVRKLVVASSMSIYGEGAYRCGACGPSAPASRVAAALEARQWEVTCPVCGAVTEPVPTPEDKPLAPASIYAITKRDQEEMCLCVGQAYGIPSVALRFFNVYGERQALSNPYTGVAAIFASRLLNGRAPVVYEDGRQTRDFVHVSDVVRALVLAADRAEADHQTLNVGTGRFTSVADVARTLAASLGSSIEPEIVGRCRAGDIRHCVADIGRIRRLLGYEPRVRFADGMAQLAAWMKDQRPEDRTATASAELRRQGLIR